MMPAAFTYFTKKQIRNHGDDVDNGFHPARFGRAKVRITRRQILVAIRKPLKHDASFEELSSAVARRLGKIMRYHPVNLPKKFGGAEHVDPDKDHVLNVVLQLMERGTITPVEPTGPFTRRHWKVTQKGRHDLKIAKESRYQKRADSSRQPTRSW